METEETNTVTSVNSSAHQEGLQIQQVGQIIKDESGENVRITEELQQEALKAHGQLEGAFFQLANALYNIKENKLYTALGFTSFRHYCKETLPFGVRSAYDYAMIGERYGQKLLADGVNSSAQVEQVGLKKLKMIAQNADEQVNKLITEGKIEVDNEEYTTEELKKTTLKKLQQELKKLKPEAERAKELEYNQRLLEKENRDLQKDNKELDEYREIRDNEMTIRNGLDNAARYIEDANRLLNSMNLNEAPGHVQKEFVGKMNYIYDLLDAHRERYAHLFTQDDELA